MQWQAFSKTAISVTWCAPYLANTTAEWLNVEVRSNKDAMLHHPYLASEVLLNANQTYTLTLSNVNSGQSAQLAITPGVIPSPVDIATWGAHKNTANGAVQAIPHDDDTVALWMYLNGRSAAVHLSDPNP